MIFDLFGSKKTQKQIEQEKEMEQAWSQYGKEVDAFLDSAKLNQAFERLEKSKAVTRPKLTVQVMREKDALLSIDIKLRIKRGEIQESKAYRFMVDPELKPMLYPENPEQSAPKELVLSEDLKKRVYQGEIQGSKACRFMTDPELKSLLF
ncbi:MAG: hypothetical protein LBD29_01860 [Treponema sp.]|nr:hypothetical protein [Treponema sp.]